MLYDRAEKKRRGYIEKDSIVRQDGSEKLVGKDWNRRKLELWERSGGRCEWVPSDGGPGYVWVLRCRAQADDPHHITPRSKGRDDRINNLLALCRTHHRLLDDRKIGGRK